MNQKKITHRRLVADTSVLHNEITMLGFNELKSFGYGMNEVRVFNKGNKYIHSSYRYLKLFTIERGKKEVEFYKGLTIHDGILRSFSSKDFGYNIKNK